MHPKGAFGYLFDAVLGDFLDQPFGKRLVVRKLNRVNPRLVVFQFALELLHGGAGRCDGNIRSERVAALDQSSGAERQRRQGDHGGGRRQNERPYLLTHGFVNVVEAQIVIGKPPVDPVHSLA